METTYQEWWQVLPQQQVQRWIVYLVCCTLYIKLVFRQECNNYNGSQWRMDLEQPCDWRNFEHHQVSLQAMKRPCK